MGGQKGVDGLGQLDGLGDFARRHAGVDHAHRLVVRVPVHVAVHGQKAGDVVVSPDRPLVLGKVDLGACGVADHAVQVFAPLEGVAHLGAAQRVEVVHGLHGYLGTAIGLELGDIEGHFGRRFRARCTMKLKAYAIYGFGLLAIVNGQRRCQNADRAQCNRLAVTRVDGALGAASQIAAVHVAGAPAHGDTHHQVFAGSLLHEAFGRHDRNVASGGVFGRNHAKRAAEMVDMAVAENQRRHRLIAQVLARKGHGRRCGFASGERVYHDPTRLAFDQCDVGYVKAAQLVNAFFDLEQANLVVQLGFAPQAGVDRGRCLTLHKGEGIEIPQHLSLGVHNVSARRCDESALGVGHGRGIVQVISLGHRCIGLQGAGRSVTARRCGGGRLVTGAEQADKQRAETSPQRQAT